MCVLIAVVNGNYLVSCFNALAGFSHCRFVYHVERDRRQVEADSWWIDCIRLRPNIAANNDNIVHSNDR